MPGWTYIISFIIIALAVAFFIGGLLLVRKIVGTQTLRSFHEVAGYMLAVIGTLYAVVLGFTVVDALSTFQKARITVEQEANSLLDIFHLSEGLPAETRNVIREQCHAYVNATIESEWPAMENCTFSPDARKAFRHLWSAISTMEPKDAGEQNIHQAMITEVSDLADNRSARLVAACHVFDPLTWGVLLTGGTFTIFFTYFFALENVFAQILMTALITIMLSLNLFLVAMFGYPFAGDVKVFPEALTMARQTFESEMRDNNGKEPSDNNNKVMQ